MPAPTARRCSSPPRSTARPAASPKSYTRDARRPRARAAGQQHGRDRAPLRRRRARRAHRRAARASCAADRDLALVFVRTKRGADRLVKRLSREGVNAVAMHGDKSQGQRERALAQLRERQGRHARRDRRRRPRHRRRRHLARHQLRPAGGPRRLRAPHRPHRPRRAHRRRHHLRRRRAGARRRADRRASCGSTASSRRPRSAHRRARAAAATAAGASASARARAAEAAQAQIRDLADVRRRARAYVRRMDVSLYQMIALERRERWMRAAAEARRAHRAAHDDGPAEDPLGADSSDPSVFFESLLAPMPVPRAIWWRNGIAPRDEASAHRSPRR